LRNRLIQPLNLSSENPLSKFALECKPEPLRIDPATYRKIRFVNPKREKEVKRMKTMFDMRVIDSDLGGEKDPAFDVAQFGGAVPHVDSP
jgi:hypothetical protein